MSKSLESFGSTNRPLPWGQSWVPFVFESETVAGQAPLSMGILQARIQEWVAMPNSRGPSQPRD